MSFLRHGESIAPMRLVPLGASNLARSQCSSDAMSSSRLFLGRLLSSRACLRFAGRQRFSKTKPRRTMILQRTATTPLNLCLTPRVHSTAPPAPRERSLFCQGACARSPCIVTSETTSQIHVDIQGTPVYCFALSAGGIRRLERPDSQFRQNPPTLLLPPDLLNARTRTRTHSCAFVAEQ